jgi:hypothetical protein
VKFVCNEAFIFDLFSEINVKSEDSNRSTTQMILSYDEPSVVMISRQGIPQKVQIENANALLILFNTTSQLKLNSSTKLELFYDEVCLL